MAHTNFQHPDDSRRIVIHEWQIEFCGGSQAAAAVMSYLDYWHAMNKTNQKRVEYLDDLRRKRGLSDDLDISWEWQFHTLADLASGTVIFGRTAVWGAVKKLQELQCVEVKGNPFDQMDRTKWFKFNPAPSPFVCLYCLFVLFVLYTAYSSVRCI